MIASSHANRLTPLRFVIAVDVIVDRREMREKLGAMLGILQKAPRAAA